MSKPRWRSLLLLSLCCVLAPLGVAAQVIPGPPTGGGATFPSTTCANQVGVALTSQGILVCAPVTPAMTTGLVPSGGDVSATGQVTATHLAAPLPFAQGGIGPVSGLSGGLLYFTSPTTLGASPTLPANAPLVGGGVGQPPTTGTRSGTTLEFATILGPHTTGKHVAFDVDGNLMATALDVGGGGGAGDVTSVFGRTGAISAQAGDYTAAQVTNAANLVAANVFTAAAGQTMPQLVLSGATSGTLHMRGASVLGASLLVWPQGLMDFSNSGGPSQVVRQSSHGATLTVSQLALSDVTGTTGLCFANAACDGYQATLVFTPEDVARKATSTALGTSDVLYPSQNAVKSYIDTGLALKQNVLGFAPENTANKATSTALGISDILYPTQNAVKVYVDTGLGGKQANLGFTPENSANKASTTALGTSDLFYPTQNAVKVYVDAGLATRQATLGFTPENVANKAPSTALGTSDLLYPTQNAVKGYVDTALALKQNTLAFTPEDSANKAISTTLGTSNVLYPSQNAVKGYVDTGLALKQNTLAFTPEDSANKAVSPALGTSNVLYPSQNAVKAYVDAGLAAKQATITWGAGLTLTGSTAAVASTQSGFLTNGVATPLTCGLGSAGRMQVLASGEVQYCDGAGVPLLRSGLLTQSGLAWNVTPSSCTADANGGKLTLNPSGTQIICASDIGGTGGGGGVDSVFGRTGAVLAQTGDYNAAQVTNAANLTTANTFTHASGQTMARLMLTGATSGAISLRPPAVAGTSILILPAGSTDFSTTGGAGHALRQSSIGAAFTVSQLAFSDLAGVATDAQIPNLNTLGTGLTPLRCVETDASGVLTVAAGLCGAPGAGLPDPGANGFVVRNSVTPTTVSRSITSPSGQITVANGDGVAGNPALGLASSLTLAGTTTGSFSGPLAGNATTASNLAANPTDCAANQFATTIGASGNLGCLQPTFAMLGGSATAAQLPNAAADGATKGIVAFAVADFECTTGVCGLDYTNAQAASSTTKGLLTSADWILFNAKQAALGFTPEDVARKATSTSLGTSDILYPSQNAVKAYVDTGLATKQATITWGAGLTITGSTASTASQEAHFLADGGAVDLACGGGNEGKMQVLDNGTLQYCDGATTSGLQTGRLTPPPLTWNVTPGLCTADGNAGKLTVNVSNQIVCAVDAAGAAGDVASVGNCLSGACLDGSVTGGTTLALYDGDSHKGTFQTVNLTADQAYNWPNESGTVCTTGSVCTGYQASLGFAPVPPARTLTLTGTTNQVTVAPTGPQDLTANRDWTLTLPQNIDTSALVRYGSLGLNVAAPTAAGQLALTGSANNLTLMTLKRFTDGPPTPAGNFVQYQNAAGTPLWTVDITGSLAAGIVPGARVSDNTITLPKLQTVPTDSLLGRDTAGTGNLEVLTVGGGVEFTGVGGIQRSAITGDVSIPAGSAIATIQPNAVALSTDTTGNYVLDVAAGAGLTKTSSAGEGQTVDLTLALSGCAVTGNNYIRGITPTGTCTSAQPTSSQLADVASLVTLTGSQRLTNKQITPRYVTPPVIANTITPDLDTTDVVTLDAIAANLTILAPIGTGGNPVPGHHLSFRFRSAVPRALTWPAVYSAENGLALPVVTTGDGTTYDWLLFVYNATSLKYGLLSSSQGMQRGLTTLASSTTYTCPAHLSKLCEMQMTEATGMLTVAVPPVPPVNGELVRFGFLCTNDQAFAWNAVFIASPNVPLPTTCPGNTTRWTMAGFQYSSVLNKYQLLATN